MQPVRRAGELLAKMELHGGDRKSNSHDASLKLAAEIKIRAERRAGELLSVMEKNTGKLVNRSRSHDATATPSLSDLGPSTWEKVKKLAAGVGGVTFPVLMDILKDQALKRLGLKPE